MKARLMKQDRKIQIIAYIVLGFLTFSALLPFILLIIVSFTDNSATIVNGYSFLPEKFSLSAYQYILGEWQLLGRAYGITIFVAAFGTLVSIIITSMLAYALSHENLPGKNILVFLVILTMLFNGGLVSTYFIYSNVLHIKNTIWAQIVPYLLMNGFNVILVKNYFTFSIPKTLTEAANLDGANEFQIFTQIMMPLSTPILVTVGLMSCIAYWNDWTNGLYFLSGLEGAKYYNIQNILNQINQNISFLANNSTRGFAGTNVSQLPTNTILMAMAVVAIIPIVATYPFFMKYFVKGITVGAVKE